MFDDLHELEPGDRIAHDQWNMLVQFVKRTFAADHYFEDESGLVIFDQGGDATEQRHFELKSAHTPGSTTPAHPQDWNGSAWVTDTDSAREFDVTDPLSEYRGRGKDTYSTPHDDGSIGVAEQNSVSDEWEIVRMQPNALALEGSIYADATLEADGVHVMNPSGAIIVDQDPAGNITFTNPHSHADIDEDMLVYLVWDESIPGWTERQKDCP